MRAILSWPTFSIPVHIDRVGNADAAAHVFDASLRQQKRASSIRCDGEMGQSGSALL